MIVLHFYILNALIYPINHRFNIVFGSCKLSCNARSTAFKYFHIQCIGINARKYAVVVAHVYIFFLTNNLYCR